MVGGKRHLHIGATGKQDQTDTVILQVVRQPEQQLFGAVQAAGLDIPRQHALADVQYQHDIDTFAIDIFHSAGLLEIGSSQDDDDKAHHDQTGFDKKAERREITHQLLHQHGITHTGSRLLLPAQQEV